MGNSCRFRLSSSGRSRRERGWRPAQYEVEWRRLCGSMNMTVVGVPLVNIILVFGRRNDRNVQCIVNGRFGDRWWTYLCISSNFLNVLGPKIP